MVARARSRSWGGAGASPAPSTSRRCSPGATSWPEKDDSSQAEWLGKQGAGLVRGTAEIVEPGLVRADGRDLPYDDLLVATGSLPAEPPLEGLSEARGTGEAGEATSASEVPESLLVVGGGAVGCELAQLYRRLGAP